MKKIDFEQDEEKDRALIKEALGRCKSYEEASKWLSSVWKRKYSSEFGGVIELKYSIANNSFTLTVGKEQRIIEAADLGEIPAQIKFFRKS